VIVYLEYHMKAAHSAFQTKMFTLAIKERITYIRTQFLYMFLVFPLT
jgi:hypothetical protein